MNDRVRLERLVQRDGLEAARQWARATAALYRQSIEIPEQFPSQPDWKPRFEQILRQLEQFAETGVLP